MILVTGAAGKTGRAIIQALIRQREAVRALVYRGEQATLLEQLGVTDTVIGDLRDRSTLERAARGTRAIYHICPNMHPEEIEIGRVAIAAARAAGTEHFVYHSVLHPQIEAMPHHWNKLRVEEQLLESGLAGTILQPAAYMQNVLAGWSQIYERGIYRVPYAAETRLSLVDLGDVAEVAAMVLTESGHEGATYELSGPGFLSQSEVASTLERQLRREVRVEVESIEAWTSQARAAGLDDYRIDSLIKMFRYYQQHDFRGNPQVLEWLLDRSPTSFRVLVDRVRRSAHDTR